MEKQARARGTAPLGPHEAPRSLPLQQAQYKSLDSRWGGAAAKCWGSHPIIPIQQPWILMGCCRM